MDRPFRLPYLIVAVMACALSATAQTASDSSSTKHQAGSAGITARRAYADGKLDVGAPFDVEMRARLGPDGKIDPASVTFPRSEGNAGMNELVKGFLVTIDQSGYTRHLAEIGASDIVVRTRQDDSLFNATLTSEMSNVLRAITVKTMATAMVSLLKAQKSSENASEADRRDLTLLNGTTATSSGRSLIIALELPKVTFREMVEKELKK